MEEKKMHRNERKNMAEETLEELKTRDVKKGEYFSAEKMEELN